MASNSTIDMKGGNLTDLLNELKAEKEDASSFLDFFYLSYMPLCSLVGLIGNALVWILITSNQIFKRLPSSSYLLALAVVSSVFLVYLLSFWVEEGFMEGQRHSDGLCKISTFVAHNCDFMSVWLIVLVGFERLTLLYKATLEPELSKRQVAFLLLISTVFNVYILFVAEVNEYGGCDINTEYEQIYNTFSLLETGICMLIPSIFIIVSNVLVILKLRAHFKRVPTSPSVSFNNADIIYSGTMKTVRNAKISKSSLQRLSARLSANRAEQNELIMQHHRRQSLRYTDLQLTRSLVIITSAFILLNLPNYVYRIGIQMNFADQTEFMHFLQLIAHILLYTHHALIFFVYIFNSPQMRKRLAPTALKLLECYCFKTVQDYPDRAYDY